MANTSGDGAGVHWSGTLHSFNNYSNGASYDQTQGNARPSGSSVSGQSRSASGTRSSFEAYGSGPQYIIHAGINSGENPGNRSADCISGRITGLRQQQPSHSGTRSLFENKSSNSQIFYQAKINSGANSGDRRMPREWRPTVQGNNECSGTLGSFNNYGNGSQDFTNANINSGATVTQDYENNHESTQPSRHLGISNVQPRNLAALPNFPA